MERVPELEQRPVFCGVLPGAGAATIMQFVLGRVDSGYCQKELVSAFLQNECLMLEEPIVFMRVMAQIPNPAGGFMMGATHQAMSDPYWPLQRGQLVPFRLGNFITVKCLDPDSTRDNESIIRYEKAIIEQFAAKSGLSLTR
jgi:hypothetical protein